MPKSQCSKLINAYLIGIIWVIEKSLVISLEILYERLEGLVKIKGRNRYAITNY